MTDIFTPYLSFGQNLHQPRKNHGVHEKTMIISDPNSHRI